MLLTISSMLWMSSKVLDIHSMSRSPKHTPDDTQAPHTPAVLRSDTLQRHSTGKRSAGKRSALLAVIHGDVEAGEILEG
jgi:hypothetical protein